MSRPRLPKNAALAWLALPAVAGALALVLLLLGSPHTPGAAAAGSLPELFPSTDVAVPAQDVVMLGASTSEPGAPGGATWGLGALEEAGHSTPELVRYTAPSAGGEEGGWEPGPELPRGFEPDQPNNKPSPLVGQVTPEGYGELAGTIPGEMEPKEKRQVVLVRKPGTGEAFQETPPVPVESETEAKGKEGEDKEGGGGEEPLRLKKGQMLFGSDRAPMIAPLAESDGAAGALVAPTNPTEGVAEAVLHWDGKRWACEPIAIPEKSAKEFNVLAIAASGPENAWLLARLANAYGAGTGAVALFRRVKEAGGKTTCGKETGDGYSWQPVEVEVGPGEVKLPLSVPVSAGTPAAGEPFGVVGAETPEITVESQLLTVTSEGVWVDGVRTDAEHHLPFTTMYLRPERRGEGAAAKEVAVVARSWCNAAPEKPPCQETLPQEPPLQYGRSIAWSGSGPYGQRVITGLFEGVTLRLQGGSFAPVLSIGGGEQPETVPGKLYGAAFGSPNEGWLGYQVPVHLMTAQEPDGLGYWPVATRDALLAVAPEPGAPVAALSSEALAVGERGSVARYKPGVGWLPESLFGPGERIETPNLRAVAWPRSNRIYAVGEEGAMWLWRAETGLWEPDPATPINFRANLYGVAFDPEEPARGYAVGTQFIGGGGVILRYGKTWTQEPNCESGASQQCIPEEVKNAQFTGIAFAGSQALVAYNLQTNPQESNSPFKGGLLVNDGGGWSIDSEEQQVTGGARVQAVAALPDGGAAVLAGEGSVRLYERESAGAPWRQAATPLPSGVSGSLALYRENGALRALVSTGGAADVGRALEDEPPPGTPPYLTVRPSVSTGSGAMLRQTAGGWSDERHDIDPVEQSGLYADYDEPYRPDPLIAALVSPSGSEAWAVGGITGEKESEQTADVARYPATGQPPNEGTLPVPVAPEAAGPGGSGGVTTLAFGGGASCAAPCAARVRDGIGPQTWLTSAVSLAQRAGASAFFYTGPMVHYSSYSAQRVPPPPFGEEYARYAGLFGGAALPAGWPAYAAGSDGELEGESALAGAFSGLASPLGSTPASGWAPAGTALSPVERETCDCAGNYYAVKNEHVRVVVLDDAAGDVDGAQRVWLEQQLQEAGQEGKPAIVVAEADLGAQLAPGRHDGLAEALFAALTGRDPDGQDPGGYAASAYFYDAPEKNVSKTVSFDGASLHVIGSGTLGYELQANENTTEFHGAKGVLFGEVQWSQTGAADLAPVQARLVPVVGEVAMESAGGALLRRSHVSLFKGLARTPRAGCRGSGEGQCEEGHYVPVPSICVGVTCAEAVLPEYEFRSSEPAVGGFVKLNTAAGGLPTLEQEKGEPSAFVLLNGEGQPVADGHEEHGEQVGATSGLFCAYNAGETNVTIVAGGLSYTLPVTVQAGSVRQPCGTVPLRHFPVAAQSPTAPVPPPAPAPAPAGPSPAGTPPVVPVPPPPAVPATPVPPARPVPAPPPFFVAAVTPFLPVAFVPPPLPAPAEPTPPTGTSAVTSPVEAAQKEEEEEEATESVSNQALAYHPAEHDPAPEYVLGLVLLAAFAGASTIRRRPRRGRRGVKVAPATLTASRSQQRMSRDGRVSSRR